MTVLNQRMKFLTRIKGLLAICLAMVAGGQAWAEDSVDEFPAWLADFRKEAQERGISQATLDQALNDLQPVERVVELDRRQPEFVDTFLNYLNKRVSETRIRDGRELLHTHLGLLREIESKYGVPAQYLVAFWGLETNYGTFLGDHPTIAALATLAFEGRRGEFFRGELLEALRILDAGHISVERMNGSWAGAMGQMQFMPSTFQAYAVDGDGDGRKDLWNSLPDAFASAANYLSQLGWNSGEIWGRQVRLPEHFDWNLARLGVRKSVNDWAALGVRRADGRALPRSSLEGAIVLPQGYAGPAFLVYNNFRRMMGWNRSINYALAVGHLADRLQGAASLRTSSGVDNRRLTRDQAMEIQALLNQKGLYHGNLDGILGSRTRSAIQDYQKHVGLPADGYPSLGLLEHMRNREQRVIKSANSANSTPKVEDEDDPRQM